MCHENSNMPRSKLKHQVSQHFCLATNILCRATRLSCCIEGYLTHDSYIHGCSNTQIFSFTNFQVLRHATPSSVAFVRYTVLQNMKIYVLFHFEHKNDVTIIIKLHRATRLRLVTLYKSLTMIVASFLCPKCNRT